MRGSTGRFELTGLYWLFRVWRFLQDVPSMVVLLVVSSMRGSTGCFEYTGLYWLFRVWRFLQVVPNIGGSTGCLKY